MSPSVRRSIPRILASLCALGGGLVFATTPALAEQTRIFTGSFGAASSVPADPYPLSSPSGIAVDEQTGDVYVVDSGNDRVEKFGPSGEFILMFGKEVNQTEVMLSGSEAEQDVCTAASLDTCQAGVEGSTPGAFSFRLGFKSSGVRAGFLAVDNSAGPSRGDVYVADSGDALVSRFTSSGELVKTWGDDGPGETPNGQLIGKAAENCPGPSCSPSESFLFFGGVTVDATGNLWVSGADGKLSFRQRTFEFTRDASFIVGWDPSTGDIATRPDGDGIAVDSEDNVYMGLGEGGFEFTEAGQTIGRITPPDSTGLALDSSGTIYLNNPGGDITWYAGCHPVFENGIVCAPTGSLGGHRHLAQSQLAVDSASPHDTLYAPSSETNQVLVFSNETVPGVSTAKPSSVVSGSATLGGTVNPSGVALEECFFEWGETEAYGQLAPCAESPAAIGQGSEPVEVHAHVTGLQAGKSYHYRLVATNANDLKEPSKGQDVAFGPPLLGGESSAGVTATSATAQVEFSPQNVDTRVRMEYGTSAGYGQEAPEIDGGSGAGEQSVSRRLQGLAPGTVYHYRFVLENALAEGAGSVVGPDETFTTQGAGGFALPDGRKWEMVSPAQEFGARIEPIRTGLVVQAAVGGDAMTYAVTNPSESQPQGYALYMQVLATRGAAGWSARDLGIPHAALTGLNGTVLGEYPFFSADLSSAIVQPLGAFTPCIDEQGARQPCLSEAASEQTAFLRADFAPGGPGAQCTQSCYRPLVTGAEPDANVPEGTKFGEEGKCPIQPTCGPEFVGASPDATHVVLNSSTPLTETTPVATKGGLYEWNGGAVPSEQLRLVSVLPPNAKGEALPAIGPALGRQNSVVRNAISDDGERIVWNEGHLYLRENAARAQSVIGEGRCVEPASACTVQLDSGLSGQGEFQTANSEVTRVFFTDGGDLYEYDVEDGKLEAVTEGAKVQGLLPDASEDGSWVYFVANGVLAEGAVAGNCESVGVAGECNLYVRHGGAIGLVAVLSGADFPDWAGNGNAALGLGHLTARVSPNGEWLAFMSQRSLTGYDNTDARSGKPDEEVYEYDARTGALVCASCNPTGERPTGIENVKMGDGLRSLAGGDGVWPSVTWLAANIPGWTPNAFGGVALYQSRYLSNSGRLFFNSSDGLVPSDVNGQEDVYEFEPRGVGPQAAPCGPAVASGSEAFEPGGGCVGLISAGTSAEESAFVDASESGGDVFFLTSSHLSPRDVEGGRTVYDAHECTAQSPCLPAEPTTPPPCATADACRAAPSPQPEAFGTPASATFSGAGNLAPRPPAPPKKTTKKTVKCAKGKKLSRGKCVKAKSKKAKKAKRATSDRRASR
jgi:DNA-binding beta-propeller fold protein YncE